MEPKDSQVVVKLEQIEDTSPPPQEAEVADIRGTISNEVGGGGKPILQTCTPEPTVTPPTRSLSPNTPKIVLPAKPTSLMPEIPDSPDGYLRVYVGNLHPSVLSKDLLSQLATIVETKDISIILTRLPTTQYAFVVFKDKSSALLAIDKLQGIRLLGNPLYFEVDPFPFDVVGKRRHVDCWIKNLPASTVSEEVEAIILAKVPLVGKLVLKPYTEEEGVFAFFTVRSEEDANSVMDGSFRLGDQLLEITRFLPVGAVQRGEARSPVVPTSHLGSTKRIRSPSPPSARTWATVRQPGPRYAPASYNDESIQNSARERYRSSSQTAASTRFKNSYQYPQIPPPLDASREVLNAWSEESWVGRIPADARRPDGFHQPSRLANVYQLTGEEVGWRT